MCSSTVRGVQFNLCISKYNTNEESFLKLRLSYHQLKCKRECESESESGEEVEKLERMCSGSPKDTATPTTTTSSTSSATSKESLKMEIHIDNIDSICAGRKLTGTIHIPRSIRRSMEEEVDDDILKASSSPSFSFEDNNDDEGKGRNNLNRKNETNDDDATNPKVCIYMEIIGTETTVVSTPKSYASPETFDVNYLRKTRGQTSLLYRKGIEVVANISSSNDDNDDDGSNRNGEPTIQVPFEFKLPSALPGSMEYIGQYEEKYALPHQCSVSYSIEAHIPFTNHAVSQPIHVHGQIVRHIGDTIKTSNSNINNDKIANHNRRRRNDSDEGYDESEYQFYFNDSISLHIGQSVPVLKSYLCGMWNQPYNTYTLRSITPVLCLHPGQKLPALIPQYALLSANPTASTTPTTASNGSRTTLHIKLTERVRWCAQQRLKDEITSWTLSPNNKRRRSVQSIGMDEEEKKDDDIHDYYGIDNGGDDLMVHVPTNVRSSLRGRLIEVRHDIMVSVINSANETVATTDMIPVIIASNGIGTNNNDASDDHKPDNGIDDIVVGNKRTSPGQHTSKGRIKQAIVYKV